MNALALLTTANALLYLAAALFHSGVTRATLTIFPEPSPPASVAEGLIGAVLAVAAVMLFRSPSARLAWAAYIFALAGTLLGLSIILARGIGGPDLWVHFVMLAGLAGGFALLARARGRTGST
ncbi:MAG TPA: hypothetical protein VGR85_13155 [Candidatus Limnocylindria bacterium]|jgi:hypothetical protein|nr:hypothetical protein [Candidatus Limnocylindria bacterium]